MTKTECKKILPYKTITACEKAYKKLTQNIFDFEGLNAEELEKIKACVCLIFSSMRNDSENQIEKQLKKPDIIRAFYLYKENCSNPAVCDFLKRRHKGGVLCQNMNTWGKRKYISAFKH